ncbi:hypothetical protein B4U79_13175 [Dinothrombium tinctorium]|uniref:Trafficking protein particle complex subunit 11 n=1 Tax=Dinothrombium tinctorium TaxID=1965070 RepID=A0A3S3RXZ6_9ACAR|nr:hypothetical protein B4U79_13175 [Dinothrombium tinctorium]
MSFSYDSIAAKADDEIGDIPKELSLQPLPFIAFVGLNLNDRNHLHLWNTFAIQRQSDRIPLFYKALTPKSTIVSCKPKKSSYEWHIPKGILKNNWLQKHLFEVPSVAVFFIDLDWNHPQWDAARDDCAAKIDQLKRQLFGRSTRIALVLIQEHMSLPGDDSLGTERASELCSACDLSPKSLFVLPISDTQNFFGYIQRMEVAFLEMAKSYYQNEIKTIKAHKEQLNKTTHQLLFVRHQFKIAFFNEIKQDYQVSIKGYKQAFAYLMEVRVTATNFLEIKTIAGFLNYKICKLLFMLSEPMDAISQFRKHIDIFKSKSEPKELEFEHAAWLSKQFFILGELFEQAITAGLVPSQTQHPGYYYHEAALQAIVRKRLCYKICQYVYMNENDYQGAISKFSPLEFYGQRPWRPGCQSLEPLDIELEKEGIRALQYKEITYVNHSAIIISFLSSAMAQFKKHKCPRMMRYMMALIAEEYFSIKDYANALVYLYQILPFHRVERWKPILISLLKTALYSVYLSANCGEFVKVGLEYLSSWNNASKDEKQIIQKSVENVLKCQPPLQLNFISNEEYNALFDLWQNALQSIEQQVLTLNMNSVVPFIEVKPVFQSKEVSVDKKAHLSLFFKTNCPESVQFSRLRVVFTHQYYNDFCSLNKEDSNGGQLFFEPDKTYKIDFSFSPHPSDIDKSIQLAGISLHLGDTPLVVVLSWSFTPTDVKIESSKNLLRIMHLKDDLFAQQIVRNCVNIINRKANISLGFNHSLPALIDDNYICNFNVKNNEDKPISNLKLTIDRVNSSISEGISNFTVDEMLRSFGEEILISRNISVNEVIDKNIIFKFNASVVENFRFTVKYDLQAVSSPDYTGVCTKYEDVEIEAISPFTCIFTTYATNVSMRAACGSVLNPDGSTEIEFIFYCTQEILSPTSLGTLRVKWKRNEIGSSENETCVPLPNVIVQRSLLYVECSLPDYGVTRKHFQLTFTIYNRTDETLPLELSMENSDNFMYSGNKQIKIEIGGQKFCKQHYIMYPLVCGYVSLPKLRLVAYPDSSRAMPLDQLVDGLLPSSLQIMVSQFRE